MFGYGFLDCCLTESREVKNPPFHPPNLSSGRLSLLLVAGNGRKQELLPRSRFGGTLFEQNIKNVMREMTFAFEADSNTMPYQSTE